LKSSRHFNNKFLFSLKNNKNNSSNLIWINFESARVFSIIERIKRERDDEVNENANLFVVRARVRILKLAIKTLIYSFYYWALALC
jgi:hypothetical protein